MGSGADIPDDFALDDPGLTPLQRIRRLTAETYAHRISVYCQRYGGEKPLDRKTVERWIRAGREVEGGPDLPPLDSPERMAEWYRRMFDRQVPEVLRSFEDTKEGGRGAAEREEKSSSRTATDDEDAALSAFRAAVKAADADATGFEAALERARVAERLAFHQWQVVLERPEVYAESVIGKRKKAWEDAASVLLRAEEKAEKIMDRSAEWARWDEVEAAEGERLGVVARGVRSLFTRVATKVSLPPGLFPTLDGAFQEEVDRLFSVLCQGDFGPLLELEG